MGKVQLFGAEKALRIWIDPQKLHGFGLSASDVLTAVSQQNMVVSPGRTGDEPAAEGQTVSYPVTVRGQLTSVEEFRNITLKSDITGARLKLADIARVESGLQSYAFGIREMVFRRQRLQYSWHRGRTQSVRLPVYVHALPNFLPYYRKGWNSRSPLIQRRL